MFNYRARHSEAEALRLLLLLPTPPLLQPPIAAAAIAAATEEAEAAGEGLLLLLRGNLVVAEQTVLPRARYPPPRTVTHVRRRGPLVHACLQCTHTPPLPLTRPSAGTVRCPQGQGFHSSFPRLSLLPYRGQPPKLLAFQETSSGAFIHQLLQPREARREHGYACIGGGGSVWVFPDEYTRLG